MATPADMDHHRLIWRRVQDEGFAIRRVAKSAAARYPDEVARYDPRGRGPVILVLRDHMVDQATAARSQPESKHAELPKETCFVAHELGHALSHRKGTLPPIYITALEIPSVDWAAVLTRKDKRSIIAEEKRAWRIGRKQLAPLGFTDWETFDAEAQRAVQSYRDGLEMDEHG